MGRQGLGWGGESVGPAWAISGPGRPLWGKVPCFGVALTPGQGG